MNETIVKLRNVALIAHGGSGKTTIAEVMLFKAGATNRIGRVEEGNTIMDFEPEELKRGNSVSTSFHQFDWKKNSISIMDTPGDQNFFSDTKICMHAADCALVVIDAIDGVKVQTELASEFAQDFNTPCIIFVNKLDKERADLFQTVEDATEIITPKPIITQIPIGKEQDFTGVIDLVTMKAYTYDDNGKMTEGEIPADMQDEVESKRETFIEDVAEADDQLVEKYLEGEELSPEEISNALKAGIIARTFAPVLCGSATHKSSIGIDLLLDFIGANAPSPADLPARIGIHPDSQEKIEKAADADAPFSAFVLKTVADPYSGRLTIFRVVSGVLKNSDGTFYNASKGAKEKFNQLLSLAGKEQKPLKEAGPGTIAAVAKLKETMTGHTLCTENNQIQYETPSPIAPLISYAINAKNKGEEDKVFTSLAKILEEDIGLKLERNLETHEILLAGSGQVHVEATIEKLKRKYNVEATLHLPKIAYKETIKKAVRVQGKHKKQSGGHGQFGDCWIKMEPLERGKNFEFVDAIVGGSIPKTYIPAVEKGILEAAKKGIVAGFPCIDYKITLDDGSYHAVDSSEMAFKIAGSMAFKKAAEKAQPTILEPIMKISITTPDECMGDVMGDLNVKRGRVLGMDAKGKNQVIHAYVPESEFQTYAPDLRSITGGRGIFTIEFSHYDEMPSHEAQKIIESFTDSKSA